MSSRAGGTGAKGYYQQHSSGRDPPSSGVISYRNRDLESSFGVESGKRLSASAHSNYVPPAGLELDRISSEVDLSNHAARPGESRAGHGHSLSRTGSNIDRVDRFGAVPSVRTEVGVDAQPTWHTMGPNGKGIGVKHDVIVTESGL